MLFRLVTDWPGMGNMGNTEKVPSRISYGPPPDTEIKWGNLIRPTDKSPVHALMKLRLDERLKRSKQLRLLLAFLTENFNGLSLDDLNSDDEEDDGPPEYPGKAPVDIVADYLTVSVFWLSFLSVAVRLTLACLTRKSGNSCGRC